MIFLVRHGEAAAGWGDHPDPGLSALGHEQAETVNQSLQSLGGMYAISSPMQRCRETAVPFSQFLGEPLRIEPAVSEIITPAGVEDRVSWLRNLMGGQWPAEMSAWRAEALEVVNGLPDGTVVFSHFVAINALVGQITQNEDVLVFRPDHCSITVLERGGDGKLRVKALGQSADTKVL